MPGGSEGPHLKPPRHLPGLLDTKRCGQTRPSPQMGTQRPWCSGAGDRAPNPQPPAGWHWQDLAKPSLCGGASGVKPPVSQEAPHPARMAEPPSRPTLAAVRLDPRPGAQRRGHPQPKTQTRNGLRAPAAAGAAPAESHGFSGSLSQAISQGQLSGRFQGLL